MKILALRHAFWRHFSVFARKKTGIEMISTPGLRWCETNPLRTRFETIGKQGLPLRKEHPVEPALANAIFKMQQARTDAETQIIKATADAEAIRIQGEALEKAPTLVELKMVEKWNGVSPQVVGAGSNIMLPLSKRD